MQLCAFTPQISQIINTKNQRIKKKYFDYLKDAKGRADTTISSINRALSLYEECMNYTDFSSYHKECAKKFKAFLNAKRKKSGNSLSPATIKGILYAVRIFFIWLSNTRYGKKIRKNDIDYLSATHISSILPFRKYPSLEDIKKAIMAMPDADMYQRRNRAVFALGFLSGARVAALISLQLGDFNFETGQIDQNPSHVRTKNRKHIITFPFPVGEEILKIVQKWVTELMTDHHFGQNDPLFPRTETGFNSDGQSARLGFERQCWTTTASVRKIYRDAFNRVGLPYYSPHTFRSTLTAMGERMCTTPEQFKAWSQNLGHAKVMTTFTSYGQVSLYRQEMLLSGFSDKSRQESEKFNVYPWQGYHQILVKAHHLQRQKIISNPTSDPSLTANQLLITCDK